MLLDEGDGFAMAAAPLSFACLLKAVAWSLRTGTCQMKPTEVLSVLFEPSYAWGLTPLGGHPMMNRS